MPPDRPGPEVLISPKPIPLFRLSFTIRDFALAAPAEWLNSSGTRPTAFEHSQVREFGNQSAILVQANPVKSHRIDRLGFREPLRLDRELVLRLVVTGDFDSNAGVLEFVEFFQIVINEKFSEKTAVYYACHGKYQQDCKKTFSKHAQYLNICFELPEFPINPRS